MKRKLLIAMLSIVSVLGMKAQTWTASEVGEGTFYLYNVGKGQFLTRGNGWGTQASVSANSALTVTVEAVGTDYKLRTDINGSGKGLERLGDPVIYTDQSANKNSTWTFTKVADGSNGPIYTIVSKDNHGGGAGSYMTASADNTIVGPADAVTDDYGRWQLLQSWVTNSVPVNDASGWTTSQNPTFDGGNVCAEFWNKSAASIKQTVSNLPAGSYELIAVAFTRTGMTATLNAGSNTMSIATASTSDANNRTDAKSWFDGGHGVNKLEFTHAGGNLEIGLTADNTAGDHWLVWRSFVLIYKGFDLSELKAALQAKIDAVPALEGTTTTAAYNYAKDYADGINMNSLNTEEAILAASTELTNRVSAATALQADYSRYKVVRAAVLALDDDATVFTGNATVDVTSANAIAEAATTTEGVENAIAAVRLAGANFLGAVTVNQGKYFTITSAFLNNAEFAGNIDGWETNYVSGQQAQNIGYQGASYTNEEDTVTISQFIEAWKPGATLGNGYLRQTVQGLPEGKYVLEADGISTWQNDDSRVITGAYLFITAAGVDYKTAMSTKNGLPKHFSVQFLSPGDVDVTFGLKTEGATCNWLCADNFTVKFYGIDLSPYATMLAEAVSEAQALQGTIPTAAYTALNNVVTTNNQTWNTSADYSTAIAAIQEATATAKALQANYTRYTGIKTAVLAAASNTDVANADSQANAATTNEAIEAAIVTLRAALITALPNATIPAAGFIDVTAALIDNAGVRQNVDGWTVSDVVRMDEWGTGPTTNFEETEFYHSNFKFYQLLSLGTGTWEFGVTGFHRAGNHNTHFYAGEDQILIPGVESTVVNTMEAAKTYFDGGNGKVALKFFIENNQNIEVGIDNQDTETDRWTIFRDFTLKYYGPDNEILEGDLDGNGTVDAIDLEMMVKLVLGKRVEGTTVEPGTVSLSDITKLVNNMTQNP